MKQYQYLHWIQRWPDGTYEQLVTMNPPNINDFLNRCASRLIGFYKTCPRIVKHWTTNTWLPYVYGPCITLESKNEHCTTST